MKLITAVRIENFRSIRRLNIQDLDSYSPIIGLNSTGKSNILRALNLFFNGYLDEARTVLDLDRDYPDSLKSSGKRKRVSISVVFNLDSGYRPRNVDDYFDSKKLSHSIAIERSWMLSQQTNDLEDTLRVGTNLDSLEEIPPEERLSVLSFVRAVQYRYVPNHVRPADFIRQEIQLLRQSMLANLRRTTEFKTGGVAETMEALSRVAATMLKQTSEAVAVGGDGRGVAADVPANFTDLAFQIALQTVTENGLQPTDLQGSGTQSFTLLHVLDLLDRTSRSRDFGWKKAYIWAIEEPESFLHAGLRSRFASDLHNFAQADHRQVFCTTHQDEFVRVGDNSWVASLENAHTAVQRLRSRDALSITTKLRVTSFLHPLMESAELPLVLVEGKWDALYLREAIASLDLRPQWRLVCLYDIDPMTNAGGDAVLNYLKVNASVLRSRAATAPVIVLRDWEDAPKLSKWRDAMKPHEYSTAVACPETLCNPDLGPSFRGIERYLPTTAIRSVIPSEHLASKEDGSGILVIDKQILNDAKHKLAREVAESKTVGPYLRNLIEWLDSEVVQALNQIPVQLFLTGDVL